jgi:ABC-2 type transport system ATP-binding protein
MLEVQNLSKKISAENVLDGISFSVGKGSVVGVVGRNGVGKTTLFRTMMGILDPDRGEVLFDEQSLLKNPELKQQVVYVPDSINHLKSYSMKEIVRLYEATYPAFDKDYFYELLERFQLPATRKIRNFSRGMKALFHIILSFSTKAKLIILDEPTNGLDPIVKRQILQFLMEEVAERQVTLMISTHQLEEIEKVADSVIVMKEGGIESMIAIDDIKKEYKKVQVAYRRSFPEKIELLPHVKILNQTGRVTTLLIEGKGEETLHLMKNEKPLLLEELPMTLEDVFITKLGGELYVS